MSFFQVQRKAVAGIRVLARSADGVRAHPVDQVERLLGRPGALAWVDIPEWSDEAISLLPDVVRRHPLAIRDGRQRNRGPVSGFIRIR